MTGPGAGEDELDLDAHADAHTGASGPYRARDLRRSRLAVAVGVVALALVVAVGLTAQRRATQDRPAPLDGTASAQELFPVLAEPARPGTELPDDGLAEDLGAQRGTERLLAVTPAASFWVALGRGGERSGTVCLVVRPTDGGPGRGGLCTSAASAAAGLAVPRGGGPSATLFPAGASTREAEEAGDAELVPGLWVDAETASGVVQAAVEGASSRLPAVPVAVRRGTGWLPVLLTERDRPYAVVLACLRPTRVRLSVDAEEVPSRPCPDDVVVRPFVGTGEPVQVGLQAPDGLVWAAEVVTCTGSASAPTC